MKNNIGHVAGFVSALFLAACSGGAAAEPGDFQAPSAPDAPAAAPSAPAAPPAAPTTAPLPPPATDAGTTTPKIAKHCNVSSAIPGVCLENVQGKAGDTVDVDVYLLGHATCAMANEADGHLMVDWTMFSLMNDEEIVNCRTHHRAPDVNGGPDVIQWDAFGDHVVAGCNDIPIGKVDTVKIQIAPGTKPGDYDLKWEDSGFIGQQGAPLQCSNVGNSGLNGVLRVLP